MSVRHGNAAGRFKALSLIVTRTHILRLLFSKRGGRQNRENTVLLFREPRRSPYLDSLDGVHIDAGGVEVAFSLSSRIRGYDALTGAAACASVPVFSCFSRNKQSTRTKNRRHIKLGTEGEAESTGM